MAQHFNGAKLTTYIATAHHRSTTPSVPSCPQFNFINEIDKDSFQTNQGKKCFVSEDTVFKKHLICFGFEATMLERKPDVQPQTVRVDSICHFGLVHLHCVWRRGGESAMNPPLFCLILKLSTVHVMSLPYFLYLWISSHCHIFFTCGPDHMFSATCFNIGSFFCNGCRT